MILVYPGHSVEEREIPGKLLHLSFCPTHIPGLQAFHRSVDSDKSIQLTAKVFTRQLSGKVYLLHFSEVGQNRWIVLFD